MRRYLKYRRKTSIGIEHYYSLERNIHPLQQIEGLWISGAREGRKGNPNLLKIVATFKSKNSPFRETLLIKSINPFTPTKWLHIIKTEKLPSI